MAKRTTEYFHRFVSEELPTLSHWRSVQHFFSVVKGHSIEGHQVTCLLFFEGMGCNYRDGNWWNMGVVQPFRPETEARLARPQNFLLNQL